jgi:hypothetical protein
MLRCFVGALPDLQGRATYARAVRIAIHVLQRWRRPALPRLAFSFMSMSASTRRQSPSPARLQVWMQLLNARTPEQGSCHASSHVGRGPALSPAGDRPGRATAAMTAFVTCRTWCKGQHSDQCGEGSFDRTRV